MQIDLSTEDVLQIVSSLQKYEKETRLAELRTADKVARRNCRIKFTRIEKLKIRLLKAVDEGFVGGG